MEVFYLVLVLCGNPVYASIQTKGAVYESPPYFNPKAIDPARHLELAISAMADNSLFELKLEDFGVPCPPSI